MPPIRRATDRRRRVLYQSHVAPRPTAAPRAREEAEEIRAARGPAGAFGSRVNRHLRGRWYSLVPVSRFAIAAVVGCLLAIPILLTVMHHLAVTWPTLAYRDAIARPLRIDRPDSFAAWWLAMVLAVAAGATELIYRLRRHRRDDFRGHYQLWRLTQVVLLLASVHCTVGLVAWFGAWLDLAVGDRAVLSGANWIRIGLDVGGIILAMRLAAELYRCRPAFIAMLFAGTFLALSESAAWQIMTVDSVTKSTLVIAAPMLGCSFFFVSATIYLRSLFRQVRSISDEPSLRERVTRWLESRRERDEEIESDFFDLDETLRPARADLRVRRSTDEAVSDGAPDDEPSPAKAKKRGWFSRKARGVAREALSDSESAETPDPANRTAADRDSDSAGPKPKRRWLGLRAAKKPTEPDPDGKDQRTPPAREPKPKKEKKPWFSLRLKPQKAKQDAAADSDKAPVADDTADETKESTSRPKRKGLLGRVFGRKKDSSGADEDSVASDETKGSRNRGAAVTARSPGPSPTSGRGGPQRTAGSGPSHSDAADSDDLPDPEDIDWDSMSKAERRRMRKRLKRSGRAA